MYEDNFDSGYTAGELSGQNGWTVTAGAPVIGTTIAITSPNSLEVPFTSGSTHAFRKQIYASPVAAGRQTFYHRRSNVLSHSAGNNNIGFGDVAAQFDISVQVNTDGTIKFTGTDTSLQMVNDTWHFFDIRWDNSVPECSIYMDGVLGVTRSYSGDEISYMSFLFSGVFANKQFYFDSFGLDAPIEDEPPVSTWGSKMRPQYELMPKEPHEKKKKVIAKRVVKEFMRENAQKVEPKRPELPPDVKVLINQRNEYIRNMERLKNNMERQMKILSRPSKK